MKIPLNKIDPNPFRDFEIDPVDETSEAFANIKKSIDTLEFWGGIAVRQKGDRYQAAFGHHRLAALRSLIEEDPENKARFETIDIVVVHFTDAQMANALATENATQRGNEGAAANDAVQAAIRVIGKQLLTSTYENLSEENFPHLTFKDLKSFEISKTSFLNGEGIGYRVLLKHFTSTDAEGKEIHLLTEAPIKAALSTLKNSGWYVKILGKVEKEIEKELQEAELLNEQKRIADLEVSKQGIEKAIEIAEQVPITYDPTVDSIFKRDSHAAQFKSLVTSDVALEFIAVEDQAALARAIIKANEEDKGTKYLTAKYVRDVVYGQIQEALAMDKDRKKKIIKDNANLKAHDSWLKLKTAIRALDRHLISLNEALDADGFPDESDQDIKEDFRFLIHPALEKLKETELRFKPDDTNVVSIQSKKG